MAKTEILATGLSGLVGSKIASELEHVVSFGNLDLTTGVDITNADQVRFAMEASSAQTVLHLAAFTDVKAAWDQRGDKDGICYKVNVLGTQNIAKASAEFGKHLIHISTAFVFDGEEPDMYTEDAVIHPIEWYGQTKAEAEAVVREHASGWCILRIDQPFRADDFPKQDTTHKLLKSLQTNSAKPFKDHWFSPTIIEDLARVVGWVAEERVNDVWHVTCGQKVSDYEYAQLVKDALSLHVDIQPGSLVDYVQSVSRPYQRNTALSSEKLRAKHPEFFTPLIEALQRVRLST